MKDILKYKNNITLILIIMIWMLAFILRSYNGGNVPAGFHRDGAYFGYNAYSIFKTGRDISGNVLPLHLESFLQSPAGYSYFTIPFLAMFGLHEFSVRLPAILFGSLTIILVYILVRQLFSEYRYRTSLGLLSSLLLAISPWHINLPRVATENVLVVFFITLGVVLYLHWTKTNKLWLLLASFLCFGGTLLLYQAPRAFLPLFIPLLFYFYHPKSWKKYVLKPLILYLILIIIPTFYVITSPELSERIRMLSIFHHPETQLVLDEQIREDGTTGSVVLTRFFHNKVTDYSQTFLTNYFSHFSYPFLFTDSGLPDRYRIPQMGLLYLFELPLILWGIVTLAARERNKFLFLCGWILLAPFGSALTFDDVPNLQRTLIIFPALAIVSAYGLVHFWLFLNHYRFAFVLRFLTVLIIMYSFSYYLHQYHIHQLVHQPWSRQEGYKQLVQQVNEREKDYKKIVITQEESAPEILFLFYNKYDPRILQQKLNEQPNKEFTQVAFPKYQFTQNGCPLELTLVPDSGTGKNIPTVVGEKQVLYVNGKKCELEDKRIKTIHKIKRNDGSLVFTLNELQ